ncbi:hypothetical protein M405DRAFT_757036 [Rhizopogon salebrosus TDB-379]|nr:hypothetical protein M405DRAFT_757036 [Rhizopogon salebrosus TDB-379]
MQHLVSIIQALVLLVCLVEFTTAGNTTCAGSMTQWYTDAVGETACTTYQRLRQICNANYQVPNFRPVVPGDQCDDGVSSCCCNSISFGLSMLCMNCQLDVDGGPTAGIDYGPGAYGSYLTSQSGQCSPSTIQLLPSDVQSAVCNRGIKLANFLYNLYWVDGSWPYEATMNFALKDEAATNNNMYNTHCNSTTSTTSTNLSSSTSSPSTTSAPSQTTTAASGAAHGVNVPTIVGAVIGSAAVLVAAAAVAGFCWRRRDRRLANSSLDVDNQHAPEMEVASPYIVPRSSSGNQNLNGYEYSRNRGHLPTSSSSTIPYSTTTLATAAGEKGQRSSDLVPNRSSSMSGLRHEDAGVIPNLDRSWSGRLPPAYDNVWEVPQGEPSAPHVIRDSSPSHVE